VIILTMYGDPVYVARAVEAGASGWYVLKGADLNDLLQAIQKVASGQKYVVPPVSARMT